MNFELLITYSIVEEDCCKSRKKKNLNLNPAIKERVSTSTPAIAPDVDKDFFRHDRSAIKIDSPAATSGRTNPKPVSIASQNTNSSKSNENSSKSNGTSD